LIVSAVFFATSLGATAGTFEDFFSAAKLDKESVMVGLTLRGFDLNTVDEHGESALLIAVREGSRAVALFLLEQPSVKVEARNPKGESPLMLAALKGDLDMARRLIQRKAEVNKPGWTALHYAASNTTLASQEMVRLLLEHHAYIDAESPNRTTPLMMAAHYGHPAVVKLLLEEGADPQLRNEQGLTAIDFARRAERQEAADLIAAFVRRKRPTGTW
jgi:ankyrin repeat protein